MIKKILKQIVSIVIPIKKNRITIIDETPYSGSNSTALYEYILKKGWFLFEKENCTTYFNVFISICFYGVKFFADCLCRET